MGPTREAEQFAALMRMLKERSGVSFEALARRTGVSRSSLHRYCSGSKIPLDHDVARTIATACGATGEELRELHRLWTLALAARSLLTSADRDLPEPRDGRDLPEPPDERDISEPRDETPRETGDSRSPRRIAIRSRLSRRWVAVAFASVAVLIAGQTLWRVWHDRDPEVPTNRGNTPTIALIKVFNVETGCQNRTDRFHACSLGLSRNPYLKYDAANVVDHRVWHGDILYADCVVNDGDRVEDERGVGSTRWFRVRLTNVEGGFAWLPAVRSAEGPPLPVCG